MFVGVDEPAQLVVATVDVWVAPLDVDGRSLARLVAGLSQAERARAARFRFSRDARRFAAARGWLRHVLATELGTAPAEVPLSELPGKPRLLEGPCFNVSHAHELALVAVATGQVGVDVEHAGAGPAALHAADIACSPAEAAALRRLPPAERPDAFLWRWTAKEAYLKAKGLGLAVPPGHVEVATAPEGAAAAVRETGDAAPPRWWIRGIRPASGYIGGVAAEGRNWRVRLRPATLQAAPVPGGVGP